MIKVLQINLNHCEAAQEILEQTVRTTKADVVLIQDPQDELGLSQGEAGVDLELWKFQSSNEEKEDFVRANSILQMIGSTE